MNKQQCRMSGDVFFHILMTSGIVQLKTNTPYCPAYNIERGTYLGNPNDQIGIVPFPAPTLLRNPDDVWLT
jgi:hypothetical protein